MKKPKKVHCLFEQSGTFKNEFIRFGIPAEDYDILNGTFRVTVSVHGQKGKKNEQEKR